MDRHAYKDTTLWILDTSFLLHRPYVMHEVPGTYIVPEPVLRELGTACQIGDLQVRAVAGRLVRFFTDLMDLTGKSLIEGIEWTARNDAFIRYLRTFVLPDEFIFPKWLRAENPDDQVIASVIHLTEPMKNTLNPTQMSAGLVTNDDGMEMRAKAFGIRVVDPYRYFATTSQNMVYRQRFVGNDPMQSAARANDSDPKAISPFRSITSSIWKSFFDHHDNGATGRTLH
jgi:predicted ribonuclease YlaK